MNTFALIGTVSLIHLLALMSPGPDFIMTVRNSLTYSRKTGIMTAIGLGCGIAIHITYCVAGLALLISQSIFVFNAIKLLGAGYLIYIGIKSIMSRNSEVSIGETERKADISSFKAIRIGFLTNVLNPKATLFFLGLFTLVISPQTPTYLLGILSLVMVGQTILWFSLVSVFFTQKQVRSVFERFQGFFNKFFGGLLILLGLKVATSRN